MDYYTTAEVADMLKVNIETVKRWIRNDELGYIDIGGGYKISKVDLDKFIEARQN